MAQNKKDVKTYLCPSCFAREIDLPLKYDISDDEYYCGRCCYTGKPEEIENFYTYYTRAKYKDMAKPHTS